MRQAVAWVAFACGVGIVGCSGKTESPASAEAGAAQVTAAAESGQQPQPQAVPASATPDQVVAVFLDAIRKGDSATTEYLLTSKAQQELVKHDFDVVPQASPNMQFQILGTQLVQDAPAGAHVNCRWTEKYDDEEVSYDVVWVLRQQTEGWRIAGLAMQLLPDQAPQFLNFEDVADMEKKKAEAMAAMEAPAAETAAQPGIQPPAQEATIER